MKIATVSFFLVCAAACAQNAGMVLKPSEINASPALHDEKTISVTGYLEYSQEGTAIWDAPSDIHNHKVGVDHCLSVMLPNPAKKAASEYNGKHVTLTGKFNADITTKYQIILGLCNKATITLDGPQGLSPSQ